MGLAQYLQPNRIATDVEVATKAAALRILAGLLVTGDDTLSEAGVLEVLLAREALASTGVGSSVAIPHGRVGGLDEIRAAMAIVPGGVDFDAVDGEPVHILVAIIAPKDRPSQHLKVLADVSRLLRRHGVRAGLLQAPSPQSALELIR